MSKLSVFTKKKKFDVAPNLYGLFYEDINRAGDGGLYPEMIRNRAFEDSIPPERCTLTKDAESFTTPTGWKDTFNHGEGLDRWLRDHQIPYTPIPAWYAENAKMELDESDRLNSNRLASLKVHFQKEGYIYNIGMVGIPLKKGETYAFYMFAKAKDKPAKVQVRLQSTQGKVYATRSFRINAQGYSRYDATFTLSEEDYNARLVIIACEETYLNIGFTSLMPTDTYNGHGLRKDLVEKLADLNAKFLRFPGGCIVEGFTYETAMRFSNTIGPVWERPSHQLMWHYRTTNGLGFHEYLQLCEDLDVEPMYVVNCGLTCQARYEEYFDEQGTDDLLQEAINAIEYATAPADSEWGRIRAAAGHPAPFKMNYVEIGNENHGPEYNKRYKKFYDVLKKRFPFINFISNTHTEKDGLHTDIVDEHYYNNPEFFAENIHMYDNYDRKGPEIFVGEYAVVEGRTANLRCALYESMFLIGLERNQDIVTLSAYAPLFGNINYIGWYPNLIMFDNQRSYGIPTYHALSMFGKNRGMHLVESNAEVNRCFRHTVGIHGIGSGKEGMQFKNPILDGKPLEISHNVFGTVEYKDGVYTTVAGKVSKWMRNYPRGQELDGTTFVTLGTEERTEGVYQVEIKADKHTPITLSAWAYRLEDKPFMDDNINNDSTGQDWPIMRVRSYDWVIKDGFSTVQKSGIRREVLTDQVPVKLNYDSFNTFKLVTRAGGFDGYINGELVQTLELPTYLELGTVVTIDDSYVIIKLVNIAETDDEVKIQLDCDVEEEYEVDLLEGDPMAENTIDQPEVVKVITKKETGAAHKFSYKAPASSISILKLKLKK
ncbi:MAG: alpha-L-arabinofuranosidase [Clostridiaceae bacterium]|nr:alpha-L-arabinofuranosidase [Clostridiaceae bacterium]